MQTAAGSSRSDSGFSRKMKKEVMMIMEQVLRILDTPMQTPSMYGWFHLLALGMMFVSIALLHKCCRKHSPERVSRVVLIVSFITFLLEIYKQINYNIAYEGGVRLELQLYAFPWQFCSTPMYAGLLAGCIRKGKVHDALCAYLATYAVFAGAAVMAYPSTVFVDTIGINIQTMFCHASAVVIGVYLYMSGYVKPEFGTIFKAIPVFLVAVAIAVVLNEAAFFAGILEEHDFNMFFISRHEESELPVYGQIHKALPYPLSVVVYVLGFTAAASGVLLGAMGMSRIRKKRSEKSRVAL